MSCKVHYKPGDRVGLFYSHTPEHSLFFGWATFDGEHRVPDLSELRPPGQLKTAMGSPGPMIIGSEVQGRFVLEDEPHEVIWEEEAWHSPEDRCSKLLAEGPPVVRVTKAMVREVWEQWRKEGITYNGHVQICIDFKGIDDDMEVLEGKIEQALAGIGLDPKKENIGMSISFKSFFDDDPVPSLAERLIELSRQA